MSSNRLTELELRRWHGDNLDNNILFCGAVEKLLSGIIRKHDIPFHSITGRVKKIDSLLRKCEKKGYSSTDEITDIVGIRVITFILEDAQKICDLIKEQFNVDESNSIDKSSELGVDKTGYRSVHYTVRIDSSRCNLPEWDGHKEQVLEIQIRTLLEHAWASLSHDNLYKFSGVLPKEIEREFYLLAGNLEYLDAGLQSLSDKLNTYKDKVGEDTRKGKLDIEINSTSLAEYLNKKFNNFDDWPHFEKTFREVDDRIIYELKKFGINFISDLDEITPEKFPKEYIERRNSYLGLLRHIMLIADADKYFENCHNYWVFSKNTYEVLKGLVNNLDSIVKKHGVRVVSM